MCCRNSCLCYIAYGLRVSGICCHDSCLWYIAYDLRVSGISCRRSCHCCITYVLRVARRCTTSVPEFPVAAVAFTVVFGCKPLCQLMKLQK